MEKKPYKCGPNFLPDWVFHEPLLSICCAEHDRAYDEKSGKIKADVAMLKCMWRQGDFETGTFWKLRLRVQAVLAFLLVVLMPYSYIVYLIKGRIKK